MKRTRVDSLSEKNLLVGLITSDSFCKEILPIVKPEFLEIDYSKIIVKWVREYYEKYEKAPEKDIENIFLLGKDKLKPEIANLTQTFLNSLSDNYEEESNFNEAYILDQTIDYLKKKGLGFHNDKIKALLDLNEVEEAEREIAEYKQVARATSKWVNPFDQEYIKKALNKDKSFLFEMDGVLGQLIGPMKREWLIAIMGPMKRGKTFYLQEFMFGAITNGLRTAFITLEMDDTEISIRGYKRMGSFTEEGGDIAFPVFDCFYNQNGTCERKERASDTQLFMGEEQEPPDYDKDIDYKVCTYCKGKKDSAGNYWKDYKSAVWYETVYTKPLYVKNVSKNVKDFQMTYGSNLLREIAYPINLANIQDIKRDLDLLEFSEGWVPDVIIVDYADILGKENKKLEGRDSVNETWKSLKSMAQSRKCLVITGTQSNRDSIDKKHVRQTNTGEDIRKIAHIDIMPVLNQTPLEKRKGVMRIGLIAHRHKTCDEFIQAEVLQQLKAGQPLLDGHLLVESIS